MLKKINWLGSGKCLIHCACFCKVFSIFVSFLGFTQSLSSFFVSNKEHKITKTSASYEAKSALLLFSTTLDIIWRWMEAEAVFHSTRHGRVFSGGPYSKLKFFFLVASSFDMEGKIKENLILLKVILNFEEDQVFLNFIQKLQSRVQVLRPNPTRIDNRDLRSISPMQLPLNFAYHQHLLVWKHLRHQLSSTSFLKRGILSRLWRGRHIVAAFSTTQIEVI